MTRISGSVARLIAFSMTTLLTTCAFAQPPKTTEPLYQESFEAGEGGWAAMGDNGKVSWSQEAANVKEGRGALRFDYEITPGQFSLLVGALPQTMTTLQSLKFWVKASHDTPLAFVLQEQGGGRFGALFSTPKDKWQRVELKPTDFVLQEGKDDPKDANGKLDLGSIEGGALVDFNQFFAQLGGGKNNPLAQLLNVKTGARTLHVDDLIFSGKPLAAEAAPDASILDDFTRPQVNWFSIGDIGLQNIKDANPENNALQADYVQEQGRLIALAKGLPRGVLTNKQSLFFNAASAQRALLIVQLEEHSGGKYNLTVDVPGKTVPTPLTLLFKDFKPAEDSKDDNNRLDIDQVKQLLILDLTGLIGQANAPNTLWLNRIFVK